LYDRKFVARLSDDDAMMIWSDGDVWTLVDGGRH